MGGRNVNSVIVTTKNLNFADLNGVHTATMISTLKKFFFSTRLMAFLFIAFATAMAFGTFIESWYSTETSKIWVYNSLWFEAIMLLFVICFIGNIDRYRLLRWEKWPVLSLHISWILIIIGAFVTRYISFEGMMPIREGNSENVVYSDKTFLTAYVDGEINGEVKRKPLEDDLLVTSEGIQSSLPWKSDFNDQDFTIRFVEFIEGAKLGLLPDPAGNTFLKIVEAGDGNRHEHFLEDGKIANIHNILFSLNKPTDGAINLFINDSTQKISSPFEGSFMRMADQFKGDLIKDSLQVLQLRSLYSIGNIQFVIPDPLVSGNFGVVRVSESELTDATQNALVLDVSSNGETVRKELLGGKGPADFTEKFSVGGLDFSLRYGSKVYELPFSIRLSDFIAEKYPGTENGYASFMSRITVEDDRPFDYDIYMNHVLDHQGYRFFQASFDPDERGTILSVNHDFFGTWITYIGYFLLYVGLMGIMFFGKTRFKDLGAALEKLKTQKQALTLIVLFSCLPAIYGQEVPSEDHRHQESPTREQFDSILQSTIVSEEHASRFGELIIQDDEGRMKPVNTFASELLRKLSLKSEYKSMNADQVFISMMLNPALWYNTEFISLDKKGQNDSIRKIIGVPDGQRMIKATDFFDEKGQNKLGPYLQEAFATTNPNKFQQDFKDAYFRLSLLDRALSGEIIKIYPLLDNENNKWISSTEYRTGAFPVTDSLYANFIRNSIPYYLITLQRAIPSGDYSEAERLLAAFHQNQKNHGSEVLPPAPKVKTEVLYNRLDIFNRLYKIYAITGIFMFLILVLRIFKDREIWRVATYFLKGTVIVLFVWHTAGLILRWYISGHAPWSDAYESILYVSWATLGMGLLFSRKSEMTIAATTFVTSMLLWIAHQSWVDPSIGNLVPVLDSYWLMVHVAVIVASYGPLTVGMILGIVSLLLIVLTSKKNKIRMEYTLKELTIINELTLTVGLIMLTIGNFLGGQWANESWGRYWGWDPKETWALISIMVYAFVIHTRLVPGLRGKWTFNFLSIVAFGSIMMTYFGVNFYLVGLHSYASGAQVITPAFIWYVVLGVGLLGGISYWRYRENYLQ